MFGKSARVQRRNALAVAEALATDAILGSKNFTVEMETGTGKTSVYLRTIHELHREYGSEKSVIIGGASRERPAARS